jgi:glycosyltransferase involved in cell wall biosynthesis
MYIARAISSVISQTIKDLEIIVIDDGSTDKGANKVESFSDKRIKLYKNKHSGVSASRNIGVKQAQSDFISFLDADDEWTKDFVEKMLTLKDKFPRAGIYVVNNSFNNNIGKNIQSIERDVLIENFFAYFLKDPFSITTSGTAFYKDIFLEVKGFKENAVWGEDQDLWLRIALKYKVVYSNKIRSISYETGASENKIYNRVSITKEHPFIQNGKKALNSENLPYKLKEDIIKIIAKLAIKSTKYNIMLGDFKYAKHILYNNNTKYYKYQKIYFLFWIYLSTFFSDKITQKLFNIQFNFLRTIYDLSNRYLHIKLDIMF